MILQGAMGALSAVRALEDRLRDADYVSLGKRANLEVLAEPNGELFGALHDEESLSDVFEVPYALKHVCAMHRTMQSAVAQVGDTRGELTRNARFHPAFLSFALGFAIGMVVSHRAKAMKTPIERLSTRTLARCEDWGTLVALYYLVIVDSRGIIDKKVDATAYGIDDRWRSFVRETNTDPAPELQACREIGRRAGERWQADAQTDIGAELVIALKRAAARSTR